MRQALFLIATMVLLVVAPSRASAQGGVTVGEMELTAFFSIIHDTCARDIPVSALTGAAAQAMRNDFNPSETAPKPTTAEGLLAEFRLLSASADERALSRAAIEGALEEIGEGQFVDQPTPLASGAIGVELARADGGIVIVAALVGTPAALVGIQAEDRLMSVDGRSTAGMTLEDVVQLLRGPIGSLATIVVQRRGATGPLSFSPTRAVISVTPVSWRMRNGAAVIRLRAFSEQTARRLKAVLRAIRKSDATGIIVDIRGNDGGLLDAIIESADLFLIGGPVASTHDCFSGATTLYRARSGDEAKGARIIVIADKRTSSGGELFAAALVDNNRATLLGEPTLGYGVLHTAKPLSERSMVKLQTGELLRANGRPLNEGALMPTLSHEQMGASDADPLLATAIEVFRSAPSGVQTLEVSKRAP